MREILNPRWMNDGKTKISCQFKYGDQILEAVVSDTEEGNPDWKEILEMFGEKAIDKATDEYNEKVRLRREAQEQRQKEQIETMKTEALFNTKLEIFGIEEIKNSKDAKLKSRIRKAKTIMEATVFASVLLQKELAAAEQPVIEEAVVEEPKKRTRTKKT